MDGKLFYCFFAIVFFSKEVDLTYYPTVFWTPTNCRFQLNKENEKGYFIKVKSMSNVIFMCPHISIWAGKSDISVNLKMMFGNVILVDEESYKSCSIKNETMVKRILTCDKEPLHSTIQYTKETFARFHAQPGKQCYEMGQHYYFISTSDGSLESLNNTEGGYCKTKHMKLHVYVCNETETCEFEMPECPKDTKKSNDSTQTLECTKNSVTNAAQTGVKKWFSDNFHPVVYSVLGLFIIVLIVIIIWLYHNNRKCRKSEANVPQRKEKKSSIQKELIC